MNSNILPSDRVRVMGVIDPDVTAAGTVETGWVSMVDFGSVMAVVMAGTLGTNATINAKLEQATDSSGTGAKDITGKAITEMTQAGTDQSDDQAVINCRSEELDVANSFTHVRLSVTVGTATSDLGGILLGLDARYEPTADSDTVGEIVS